jgi:leishmanolysin
VVEYAKEYYGCDDIEGVPLENAGGIGTVGSHWEKLYLPNEFMNPTVENPGIISLFTLKALEDSGWYWFDEGAEQPYTWGKADGCSHYNEEECPTGNEYCADDDYPYVCSPDYYSPAACTLFEAFTGSCALKRSESEVNCVYGVVDVNSRESWE